MAETAPVLMTMESDGRNRALNDEVVVLDSGGGGGEETIPFIDKDTPQQAMEEAPPPADHYNLVYLIILLHGVGVLLPWNTFLTIGKDYFIDYKLAEANGTEYRQNFFSYLGACSQIPNLLLNALNLFVVVVGAGLSYRILGSLYVIASICVLTIALIFISSTAWPLGFFLLTMFSVIILNSANGVYQNSVYGLIADLPARFTNAVILGNNLCGIFVSMLAILTLLFSGNIVLATFLYFVVALMVVIACIVTFSMLQRMPFYVHYTKKAARARERDFLERTSKNPASIEESAGNNVAGSSNSREGRAKPKEEPNLSLNTYIVVFKEVWCQLFDIFLVFFVTLAIFPAVLVKVQLCPAGRKYDYALSEALFGQISIFLNFNVFATLGNFIANYVQWPSPKYLSWVVVPRLLFIPLFLFCNYVPENVRAHPVLIMNEWAFIVLISLMSITHGYLSSLSMMYAPRVVEQAKGRVVGMMSGFFLVLGITLGILFTFFESWFFSA